MNAPGPAPASPRAPEQFGSTQWSVVLASARDTAEGRRALEQLCRTYWLPIYGYLRRRGQAPADAEDLTQGFFAYVLEGDFLQRPDPARGRFRGYLIGALRHFLARHFEQAGAAKGGGGAQWVDWSERDAEAELARLGGPELDPSEAYERGWAQAVFRRALQRLEEEQRAAGRLAQFSALRPFLSNSPSRGDYDRLAAALGLARTTIAVQIFRLNRRYAELVRLEVAASVADPAEIEAEMRHLLAVLRR